MADPIAPPLPTLDALAAFLHAALGADAYPPDERGGVFRTPADAREAAERPLGRLGLALEPWPGLRAWAERTRIEAVFLHRPWRLAHDALGPHVGVLYSHLPFDEHLTTGDNAPLAAALGFRTREVLGTKRGRPLGMVGDVVGAMTDALVREAAARGVGLYVTGQLRPAARDAVAETGIGVAAVGHARSEHWGLGALAHLIQDRWGALDVRMADPTRPAAAPGIAPCSGQPFRAAVERRDDGRGSPRAAPRAAAPPASVHSPEERSP